MPNPDDEITQDKPATVEGPAADVIAAAKVAEQSRPTPPSPEDVSSRAAVDEAAAADLSAAIADGSIDGSKGEVVSVEQADAAKRQEAFRYAGGLANAVLNAGKIPFEQMAEHWGLDDTQLEAVKILAYDFDGTVLNETARWEKSTSIRRLLNNDIYLPGMSATAIAEMATRQTDTDKPGYEKSRADIERIRKELGQL